MNTRTTDQTRQLATEFRAALESLASQLREQGRQAADPQGRALFETSAEVLEGLSKAHHHYEEAAEPAWR